MILMPIDPRRLAEIESQHHQEVVAAVRSFSGSAATGEGSSTGPSHWCAEDAWLRLIWVTHNRYGRRRTTPGLPPAELVEWLIALGWRRRSPHFKRLQAELAFGVRLLKGPRSVRPPPGESSWPTARLASRSSAQSVTLGSLKGPELQ